MKVLITGCAGFIGYHLATSLLNKKKIQVYGLDNLNKINDYKLKFSRLKNLKKYKNFNFYKLDITNKKEIFKNFKKNKYEIVVHLAANAGVRKSLKDPEIYLKNNITGFFNIIEASRFFKIKNFLYASTSSVYGENTKLPSKESDNTDKPKSFYAATKKCNEVIAHSYSSIYQLPTVGLRFFTVYGPYGRPDMAIYKFAKSAIKNKKIELFNNGNHSRDFTYVDDIVIAITKIILRKPDTKNFYKIFNICKNDNIKLKYVLKILEKKLNTKFSTVNLPLQKGDVKNTHGDNNHLKKYINYSPKIKINEGISKFIEWFKNNKH